MSFESFEPMESIERGAANPRAKRALEDYHNGMRNLGRSLLALSILQIVIGSVLLAVAMDPLILAIVGVMAVAHIAMGVLILLGHAWVNYLVVGWAVLILAANLVGLGLQADQPQGASSPGGCIGMLIAAALFYYSVRNLQTLSKVRAAGLEP